jgi:hypothetical protein
VGAKLLFYQFMPRIKRWAPAAGAALGLMVWIYDNDFFLNAGGAEAPISRGILTATHTGSTGPLVFILWPLIVMSLIGFGCGFVVRKLPRLR